MALTRGEICLFLHVLLTLSIFGSSQENPRSMPLASPVSIGDVTVAKDGTGNFMSIGDAVKFAPTGLDTGYFKIIIKEGVYEENVIIDENKTGLMLVGDGIGRSIIKANRSVVDGWRTFETATLAVEGDRFIASGITFENTAGPAMQQAVAVRNTADRSVFYQCSFLGYQDTLYVHRYRQFYRDCEIYGTIDFIFGDAAAVLQNCKIYLRNPLPNQENTITAQSREGPSEKTGISIHNCSILAEPGLNPNVTKSYLGRPWRKYSTTVFMQSNIEGIVASDMWLDWDGRLGLDSVFYGEYLNHGVGAHNNETALWPKYRRRLNESAAYGFTVNQFINNNGWLQKTSVPFTSGLL